LSTSGSKSEMIARHSYFINLYNSNVDATNPKNKGELLREMKKWERAHQSDEVKDANLLKKSLNKQEEVDSYDILFSILFICSF
jgi:E3 ubiquitin-protein ligase RAD18